MPDDAVTSTESERTVVGAKFSFCLEVDNRMDELDPACKRCLLQRGTENWLSRFSSCPEEQQETEILQEVRALFARWLRMENVCLLVGAGASYYVTKLLTSDLFKATTELLSDTSKETLQALLKYSSKPDKIGCKFEAFLSQLAAWRSLTEAGRWPLDLLVPAIPAFCGQAPQVGSGALEQPLLDRDRIVALLADLERAIAVACNATLPSSTLCNSDGGKCDYEVTPHEALFAKLIARDPLLGRAKVFTINYDTLIEQALDRLGVLYCDGFVGTVARRFSPAAYELDFYYPGEATEGKVRRYDKVVQLYKLHGSINWRQSRYGVASNPYGIWFDSTPLPTADELREGKSGNLARVFAGNTGLAILPTAGKYGESLTMPYAHLFRAFHSALQSPQTLLLVLGYGGWDEHVNRIIEDGLSNPSFTCVIVNPSQSAWARKMCCADVCGRVFFVGGEWAKFEKFALDILPDLETLRTEIDVARTLRDLQKQRADNVTGPVSG